MTGTDADLALRLRIEALLTDYVHCIDDDRLEEWPGFFTGDGIYRVVTRENHDRNLPAALIYCAGRGMLEDRISALRQANIFEPQHYRHMTGSLRIAGRAADGTIACVSNVTVVRTMADGDMAVFAAGRYLDRIAETPDGLRFAERSAVLDSRRIDTLLVIPI